MAPPPRLVRVYNEALERVLAVEHPREMAQYLQDRGCYRRELRELRQAKARALIKDACPRVHDLLLLRDNAVSDVVAHGTLHPALYRAVCEALGTGNEEDDADGGDRNGGGDDNENPEHPRDGLEDHGVAPRGGHGGREAQASADPPGNASHHAGAARDEETCGPQRVEGSSAAPPVAFHANRGAVAAAWSALRRGTRRYVEAKAVMDRVYPRTDDAAIVAAQQAVSADLLTLQTWDAEGVRRVAERVNASVGEVLFAASEARRRADAEASGGAVAVPTILRTAFHDTLKTAEYATRLRVLRSIGKARRRLTTRGGARRRGLLQCGHALSAGGSVGDTPSSRAGTTTIHAVQATPLPGSATPLADRAAHARAWRATAGAGAPKDTVLEQATGEPGVAFLRELLLDTGVVAPSLLDVPFAYTRAPRAAAATGRGGGGSDGGRTRRPLDPRICTLRSVIDEGARGIPAAGDTGDAGREALSGQDAEDAIDALRITLLAYRGTGGDGVRGRLAAVERLQWAADALADAGAGEH